jgi:hypothetical protein
MITGVSSCDRRQLPLCRGLVRAVIPAGALDDDGASENECGVCTDLPQQPSPYL